MWGGEEPWEVVKPESSSSSSRWEVVGGSVFACAWVDTGVGADGGTNDVDGGVGLVREVVDLWHASAERRMEVRERGFLWSESASGRPETRRQHMMRAQRAAK